MIDTTYKKFAAIILAAGRGKRMQLTDTNKVTVQLADKPLIVHIVDFMKSLGIQTIIVVVGHQKGSVMQSLQGQDVLFVEQKEQLGTGHAVECAIKVLPVDITEVLVAYGDDAVLYAQKNGALLEKLFQVHNHIHDAITMLTLEQDDPYGMGRIIRDETGKIVSIIEEKDATDDQRKIKEINPGSFVFSVDFLKHYLPQLSKSSVTGEYYLTSLIDLAIKHGERVNTVNGGKIIWRGVNTLQDLEEAEKLYNIKNIHGK